ncbi:MAG: type II CAAX endopeptidase family protein [Saprospiraceae bacterium]
MVFIFGAKVLGMEENYSKPISDSEERTPTPASSEPHWGFVLLTLTGLVFVGAIVGTLLTVGIGKLAAWDPEVLTGGLKADAPLSLRWPVRLVLLLNHLFTFLLPGLALVFVFYRSYRVGGRVQDWKDYIALRRWPEPKVLLMGLLTILVSVPLVLYLYQWNQLLPIPESFRLLEEQTNEAIKGLMQMDSIWELLANILIVAALPALGEELVFRVVLQKQLQRFLLKPWHAIVLAAAIFSFIHMQFEGFLPRWMLGIVLGWLYWRTGNYWVPVVAHFFNNAFQVLIQYFYASDLTELDLNQDPQIHWTAALASILLLAGIYRWSTTNIPNPGIDSSPKTE